MDYQQANELTDKVVRALDRGTAALEKIGGQLTLINDTLEKFSKQFDEQVFNEEAPSADAANYLQPLAEFFGIAEVCEAANPHTPAVTCVLGKGHKTPHESTVPHYTWANTEPDDVPSTE